MNFNYCVIMAGGIGSRFWPISRSTMPKQFLDITGNGRTLLQQTYDRFSKIMPNENIYIVTNEEYTEIVQEQVPLIPKENILGEPMRRNTAPCIMYANFKIGLKDQLANIVVSPADHLIVNEEEFLQNIKDGLKYVAFQNVMLTLGITPDRPATGYGYIQLSENKKEDLIVKAKTFTEKPHLELAKFFIQSGDFLWNSGIFIWKTSVIDNALKEFLPEHYNLFNENIASFNTPDEKKVINRIYSDAKSISIDFGVMEKATNVFVMKTNFGWSDLGTWDSLYKLHDKDENENTVIGDKVLVNQSFSNYINIDKNKIAILNDLEDYIVINTEQALLICKRENEQQIGELLNEAKLRFGEDIK
ncbi:MAG: mannose-1-phosphate guanylyltransferase [Bacteroidales bacterium]|nr:sugar phosphate nucleotidyltransferase [Bacteroidales bacterium]MCK9498820.1 sugar phosphate nucleotidyltransferase [Bacteroidales bacterium]MDY0313990.1 sugar phosphate nucleotidyltransferase [Bacteroidales bacterium]NLB86484.1 mannose-1-phosphate guanylyltransferase [Bacteroidales bacterium]